MSENHAHYFDGLDSHEASILERICNENSLRGPTFIGQGLSKSIGSDCYGYYIVGKKVLAKNKKTIWGIAGACSVMHGSWQEGVEDCSIDMSKAKPHVWITQYRGSWYYCNEDGDRAFSKEKASGIWPHEIGKASFGWNGAYAYRDPSF